VSDRSGKGWAGKQNGELLSLAEADSFEAFVTLDRGIEYQQNLSTRIIIILIGARSSRISDLVALVRQILSAMASIPVRKLMG
jgi:hypothetical protein